jgi:hypothetical protein
MSEYENLRQQKNRILEGRNMEIGFPESILLNEFAGWIQVVFNRPIYLVGSALEKANPRDVDVAVILSDEEFEAMELRGEKNAKWASLCLAYSVLGQKLTGLPIDFKIVAYSNWKLKFSHLQHKNIHPFRKDTSQPLNELTLIR